MRFDPKPFTDAVRRACIVHRGTKDLQKFPGVEFAKTKIGTVKVRATNGDISVSAELADADATADDLVTAPFVLPSPQLNSLFDNADAKWKEIILTEYDHYVTFEMGKVKAQINRAMNVGLHIPSIDPDDLHEAPTFGDVINSVAWARDTTAQTPISGILVSPTSVGATDKFAAALALQDMNVDRNYLLPANPIRSVFAGLKDEEITTCLMGASGNQFFISPFPHVQYSFPMIADVEKYPPLEAMFAKEGGFDRIKHLDPLPIQAQKLSRIVKRLQSAGDDQPGLKVRLDFNGNRLTVSSMQGVAGQYSEDLDLPDGHEVDLGYPVYVLAENMVNVLGRLPATGGFIHLPAEELGGDLRFSHDNHWMLLGRVVIPT